MILIATVDDRNGMMFNKRRQSQDRVLRQKILNLSSNSKLWVNTYTASQFKDTENAAHLVIDDDFLEKAQKDDFCFAENILPNISNVDKLILFKWNRHYPGDFYFDLDISNWKLISTDEFEGSSHEKITMEVYTNA